MWLNSLTSRATAAGLMSHQLLRHRWDKGAAFHRDICSYCCHVGKQAFKRLIYHQALHLHKNVSKCKTGLLSKCSSSTVIIGRTRRLLRVKVANSYQWLFISVCMSVFFCGYGMQRHKVKQENSSGVIKQVINRTLDSWHQVLAYIS